MGVGSSGTGRHAVGRTPPLQECSFTGETAVLVADRELPLIRLAAVLAQLCDRGGRLAVTSGEQRERAEQHVVAISAVRPRPPSREGDPDVGQMKRIDPALVVGLQDGVLQRLRVSPQDSQESLGARADEPDKLREPCASRWMRAVGDRPLPGWSSTGRPCSRTW